MAEVLLADVAATALTALLSAAADPLIRAWGLEDDLDNLKQKMRLAQGLISDTMGTTSTVTRSVAGQIWLEQLTDMVRDAENVMAEVDYNLLRQKFERRNKVHAKLSSTLRSSRLSREIQKISASFDELLKRGQEIGLKPLEHLHPNKPPVRIPQTSPTVDESEIVGRKSDVSQLVQRLCSCCSSTSSSSSSSINDLSVLAIVGIGGLGKTTLARLVFKNEQIVKHFGVRIWVTVSDQFDTLRILNNMLQSLTQQNHTFTTIPPLIQKLQDSLGGNKRFLLVLDDVWNKHFGEWDNLRSSLLGMKCVGDNKILMTTRDTEVASTMGSCFNHLLLTLSEADSWTLFRQKAFAEGGAEETEALRAIGERLVRRCGGLPLTLRVLGGLMYSRKSESEWLSIENNPLWSTNAEVMPSLRISFDHLESSALKCCFAFCSIFPKDSGVPKEELKQYWMALGFLDDSEGGDSEDKAEVYFNRLVWSSLFQQWKDWKGTTFCGMHDLVHDLAEYVSKKYCASQGGCAAPNSIHKAIHVSMLLSAENELEVSSLNFNRVQTLYLKGDLSKGVVGNEILGKLMRVRILVLVDSFLEELPSSIGDLKQLRCLDISRTKIRRLPDSITKLYSLQTLRVDYLEELPKQFGNLISLRYFWAKYPYLCRNWLFIGVGRATGLRTLPFFAVDESEGCRLAELGSLDKLSGVLSIYNLKGVSGIEAAKKANLCRKPNIHALSYSWEKSENRYEWRYAKKGDKSRHNDEGVLEGLQPHSNLKELEIRDFKGRRLASWMTRVDESSKVLQHLVKITLTGCHHCEEISSLGHLPHLESVEIHAMGSLKRIGTSSSGGSVRQSTCTSTTTTTRRVLFPSLKVLRLEFNSELEEWSEAEGVGMQHEVFPRLEELLILHCPKLVSVPGHFPSLQKLIVTGPQLIVTGRELEDMTALENEWAVAKLLMGKNAASLRELELEGFRIVGHDAPSSLRVLFQSLTSLTRLKIRRIDRLKKFPSDCLQYSTSLEELEILSCPHLVSLPDLGRLTRLRELSMGPFSKDLDEFPWPNTLPTSCSNLTLYGWEMLKTLPHQLQHLSASLTQLGIVMFDGLESLPEWLANLSNLHKLTLFDCRNLKSLPSVEAMQRLHTLSSLSILGCPLLRERCREGSGPEWPKIAHIPRVVECIL